jgi:hypothetical protein
MCERQSGKTVPWNEAGPLWAPNCAVEWHHGIMSMQHCYLHVCHHSLKPALSLITLYLGQIVFLALLPELFEWA